MIFFFRHTVLAADGSVFGEADEFLHISWMQWSPYSPSTRRMRSLGINTFGNLELQAVDEYWTMYECCAYFQNSWKTVAEWQLRVYSLVFSERPLVVMDARRVEVEVKSVPAGVRWKNDNTRRENMDDALDALRDCNSEEIAEESLADDPPQPLEDEYAAESIDAHAPEVALCAEEDFENGSQQSGYSVLLHPGNDDDHESDDDQLHGCQSPSSSTNSDDQDQRAHKEL